MSNARLSSIIELNRRSAERLLSACERAHDSEIKLVLTAAAVARRTFAEDLAQEVGGAVPSEPGLASRFLDWAHGVVLPSGDASALGLITQVETSLIAAYSAALASTPAGPTRDRLSRQFERVLRTEARLARAADLARPRPPVPARPVAA